MQLKISSFSSTPVQTYLCTQTGCGKSFASQADLENHLAKTCQHLKCSLCHFIGNMKQVKKHNKEECAFVRCPSDGCNLVMHIKHVTLHVEQDCQMALVQCPRQCGAFPTPEPWAIRARYRDPEEIQGCNLRNYKELH